MSNKTKRKILLSTGILGICMFLSLFVVAFIFIGVKKDITITGKDSISLEPQKYEEGATEKEVLFSATFKNEGSEDCAWVTLDLKFYDKNKDFVVAKRIRIGAIKAGESKTVDGKDYYPISVRTFKAELEHEKDIFDGTILMYLALGLALPGFAMVCFSVIMYHKIPAVGGGEKGCQVTSESAYRSKRLTKNEMEVHFYKHLFVDWRYNYNFLFNGERYLEFMKDIGSAKLLYSGNVIAIRSKELQDDFRTWMCLTNAPATLFRGNDQYIFPSDEEVEQIIYQMIATKLSRDMALYYKKRMIFEGIYTPYESKSEEIKRFKEAVKEKKLSPSDDVHLFYYLWKKKDYTGLQDYELFLSELEEK